LSWGRALGPLGGLSTGQLMLPALHVREEREHVLFVSQAINWKLTENDG